MADEEAKYEFDLAFQDKIVALMARDSTFSMRAKDLVRPEHFANEANQALVRIILDHVTTYRSALDAATMVAVIKDAKTNKKLRDDQIPGVTGLVRRIYAKSGAIDVSNPKYVTDKVADFARRQAIENAILSSVPMLEKGDFAKIGELMRQAMNVGAVVEATDYDYYAEVDNRTQIRKDIAAGKVTRRGITTGYSAIDAHLYHMGWGRRELSCLMGAAKAGKSLGLGDFTKNASLAGYNVLYATLEVSKEIISDRIDAALTDTLMRELHIKADDIAAAVKKASAGAGRFIIEDYPSGVLKPSVLHRRIEKLRADGVMLDLVTVDYADIMASEYRSDNLIDNLRSIYIDLRAIAHEFDIAMLTATQTNREGAKAATAKATDVGDDWNKARTVDILIGINATDAEKKAGEARLYWALSRNTEDGFQLRIKQDREKMKFLTKVIGKE